MYSTIKGITIPPIELHAPFNSYARYYNFNNNNYYYIHLMPNYGDASYWEDRYKSCEDPTFDWLEDYSSLKTIISDLNINKETGTVLNLGCGNSEMSEEMYDDGYHNIVNIDISHNVIKYMKERNKQRPKMTFCQMDVRDIKLESNSVDLAIDKSTIDALLCGEDSFTNVAKMIKEVQRVLKVGGYYMIISYGNPESRVFHLKRKFLNFEITIFTIKKDYENDDGLGEKNNYVYLCKKLKGANEASEKYYQEVLSLMEKEEEEFEQKIIDEEMADKREDIINVDSKENNCTDCKEQNESKK